MSDAGNLMPIGRFARSCRLSIKALRHYDSEGLLAPAHIDPFSGYRYYARSQARDAILIAMLRSSSILVAQPISTSQDRLIPDTTHAIYTLMRAIRAAGRDILMPVLCMNEYDDSDDRITVYCCAAVEPPPPSVADANVVQLDGGAVASLMHRGPYEELAVAYHALYAWVQERGHGEAGLVREVYHNDPAHVDASELLTELVLPIR
jgi:effector-binding domain-containing protein